MRTDACKAEMSSRKRPIAIKIAASAIAMLASTSVCGQGYGYVEQCEDTCAHIHGIDLSHYQGDVFWEAVGDNRKMTFVYLKATEGGDWIDSTYARNIELAKQNGLYVGSYHFYRPKTDQRVQLENFIVQCRPDDQDLIPLIDIESTGGLATSAFCDSLLKFLDLVEQAYGQKPLLYTFTNFYNRHLIGKIDGYKLMIAQYTPQEPVLADERDITMWQYTGKGTLNGVGGYIDKSRFMGQHGLREIRYIRQKDTDAVQQTTERQPKTTTWE